MLLTSLALYTGQLAGYRVPHFAVIGLIPALASLGFSGSQRVWYLRVFETHRGLSAREAYNLTLAFLGRFLRLGLLFGAPAVVLILVLGLGTTKGSGSSKTFKPSSLMDAALLGFIFLIDIGSSPDQWCMRTTTPTVNLWFS